MIKERPTNIIDIKEMIPDIEVELAYATANNFTGRVVPGYEDQISFLTDISCQHLKLVQDELKEFGLGLKVFDSYRPRSSVLWLQNDWRYHLDDDPKIKNRFYPELTKEDLFIHGYVATRSSHSRASTIDLTIIEVNTCKELDMGTEFDFFGEQSHTAHSKLKVEQRKNRLLLKTLMEKNGFVNYKHEWWHFRFENEPYHDCLDFPVKL